MKIIILSIDGGGIRGIVPAAILSYLEKEIQKIQKDYRIKIGNLVDFVAGTSTGSIVGSMMLIPNHKKYPKYTMDEIVQMYFDMGDDVFKNHFWHNIKTLWGLLGPKFPSSNIEPLLLKEIGFCKLEDLVKPCMFSGYDIEKRKVIFYTNNDINKKYKNYYVKDIIRGSTSIPSYFPPARFKDGVNVNTIIDGGVFANNPSLAAYIEVSKTLSENMNPHKMIVISLGTGDINHKSYSYKKTKKWGKTQWLMPIIDVLLASHSEVTSYEMEKLFKAYNSSENYKRINPPIIFGDSNALNGSKENLTNLLKDTNNYINDNKEMLNDLVMKILDNNYLIKP